MLEGAVVMVDAAVVRQVRACLCVPVYERWEMAAAEEVTRPAAVPTVGARVHARLWSMSYGKFYTIDDHTA